MILTSRNGFLFVENPISQSRGDHATWVTIFHVCEGEMNPSDHVFNWLENAKHNCRECSFSQNNKIEDFLYAKQSSKTIQKIQIERIFV